ncbi:unnamed protein product [Linum tenue]|uniref:Uncharacterized protein n=1 Tax=Linum tenue TaxID=586396 RepID=A0AAV0R0B3_9ROSI|nr:unnamed protein product [Linum tenue]
MQPPSSGFAAETKSGDDQKADTGLTTVVILVVRPIDDNSEVVEIESGEGEP